MKTHNRIFFICAIGMSNVVIADCPDTMPGQLLEDCIVAEGSGSTFPNSTYAHMDEYQEWLKTQQLEQLNALANTKTR
jgi:hypothetical protein